MALHLTNGIGIHNVTGVPDAVRSFGVGCNSTDGPGWILINGFGRKRDAEIALAYLETDALAGRVESMDVDEADQLIDENEDRWMREACNRLQW